MTWAPLLLADPSPSLRLLVLRDLLERPETDAEVQELRQLQERTPLSTSFLDLAERRRFLPGRRRRRGDPGVHPSDGPGLDGFGVS